MSCAQDEVIMSDSTSLQGTLPTSDRNQTKVTQPTPIPTEMPPTVTATPVVTVTPAPPINPIPGVELFDFSGTGPGWYTVNDDVMGGVSNSTVDIIEQDLSFSGTMSLENNGGFSSIRSEWIPIDLSDFDGVLLRVLGDDKSYRFRVRSVETGRNISYNAVFQTTSDKWEIVYIPFADMVPTYFGAEAGVDKLDTSSISSFGFMLSDKQPGDFELRVDWIRVVSERELQIVSMN